MKFHSFLNSINSNKPQPDSLNVKELISKLDIMFDEKLSHEFKNILNFPRNKFLDTIISQVKKFLDEQYGNDIYKNEKFINFFTSSCNNLEDKYNTYMDELNQILQDYDNKKSKINDNSFFFSKFRKHCIKTDTFAMHKCSDNAIGYYIISEKKFKKRLGGQSSFQYLICNKCKTVFFTSKFLNYCKNCNESYLSSVLNHNENPDLLLVTLKNPHCDTLVNEKIKCQKCNNNFLYLNMKLNKLQCKNKSCTYNETPYDMKWNCNICEESFYSNIKIYNPVEVQEIKDVINLTLLLKKRAHPKNISCCKNINVLNQNFFHKKDCQGLLFFGEYNSKIIIVCEKCKAINFLLKFIWTCPLCGKRFKDKNILNNNNNEGIRQKLISYKSRIIQKEENNKNENNNENKKLRYNKSLGRGNKETLSSLLRRKSDLSLDKKEKNVNMKTEINMQMVENNPKTFNIKNLKFGDNKNNTITDNNIKIIQLDSTKVDKTTNFNTINEHKLKKSLSEPHNLQNSYKKTPIFEKKISNIDTIKEENDIKNNSPQKRLQNVNGYKLRELTIQNEGGMRHKSKRIFYKNEENKKENCLSPRIKNNLFIDVSKYSNTLSNDNNENNNEYKKEKNIFGKNKIIINEKTSNLNFENIQRHINEFNSKNDDSKTHIESKTKQNIFNVYESKKEKENNNKYIFNKRKNETNPIQNKNDNDNQSNNNKNNINQTFYSRQKFKNDKTQNKLNTQDNNLLARDSNKNSHTTKIITKENNNNEEHIELNKNNLIKETNNTIKIRKNKEGNDMDNREENGQKEKLRTFRYRSIIKYKIEKEKEKQEEKNKLIDFNKNKEENKNSINNEEKESRLNLRIYNNRFNKRDSYRENFKTFNTKKEEEENKDIKERKTVKSRKEILKEKEKNDNMNLITEKKEKETINKLNLNTFDIQENKRYTINDKILDSHQETLKTKDNTISRYTKDSYTSKDNNAIQVNKIVNRFNNIHKYRDLYNKNNENKEIKNDINNNIKINENKYNTEIMPRYNIRKTRKEYFNERNKNNNENLKNETTETKINISNKREILTRTSFQTNKKSTIIMNSKNTDIEKEEDIPIFDKDLRKNKIKYAQLQYQLKSILYNSCLPKFNIDYYIIKDQIGTGSFGVIYQVYNIKTRCKFALKKIFSPDIPTLRNFVKKLELLHQNPHDNILDLIGVCIQCVDITNYILYVLMDLAQKDWDKEINYRAKVRKYYSEIELLNILRQLNSALFFLEKDKKIAHRDIKPENILIFNNNIYKIGDFGEAKENKIPKQFNTLRGTELYMSPILYKSLHENKEDVKHNPFKSDMFSLGYCFIYAASLNLDIIFKIRDINNTFSLRKILMKEFNRRYSEKFVNLILKMICFDEEKRIDFIDLEKILKEQF